MTAAVRAEGNRRREQGPVVEAAGGWVGELHGAISELGDGPAGPGSGRRDGGEKGET
jgi:hypothetical protein